MTKSNAIKAILNGDKIRHKSWGISCFIRKASVDTVILDEQNNSATLRYFFDQTCADEKYDVGWRRF